MKQKTVGVYSCGFEDVQIVLRDGTGGEFHNCPGKGQIPRIKIGADYEQWRDVVSVLTHEAFEFTLNRAGCRYDKSYDMGQDASAYLFVFTHVQFSDACARVAELLATCLPDLAKAWGKWGKRHVR